MKVNLTVVLALVAILALAKSQEQEEGKHVPAFVRSFNELHKGPPVVDDDKTRAKAKVSTKWIIQKVDNFDESNEKTWEMRYMVNEDFFEEGGPIFIYIGGEWSISPGSIQNGIYPDIAKEHKGILFYTEHRYYGESKPTKDILVENLKYLHVKQSLADLAHFIRTIKANDPRLTNAKVIIAGCSYSATMAVWFSKVYPDLVDGSWASSAPLLAKVDFFEYKEVVGKALQELGSQQCYDRVQNGIAELEAMFAGNRSAEAKALLKLCNSFDHHNDLDLWSLFGTISNIFAGIVQYQKKGDIPKHCNYLMSFEDDLTAITSFVLKRLGHPNGCIDVSYIDTLSYYLDSTYGKGASRPWFYQTCNEYGWFQSSSSRFQPFGTKFPVELYTTMCYDIFGSKYTNEHIHQLVDETNMFFGGLNPQVKNVFISHGGSDPWNAMGLTASQGASVIPRASHCEDMSSISANDSADMRASKERLMAAVREWLA